jgi:hypothetical protein
MDTAFAAFGILPFICRSWSPRTGFLPGRGYHSLSARTGLPGANLGGGDATLPQDRQEARDCSLLAPRFARSGQEDRGWQGWRDKLAPKRRRSKGHIQLRGFPLSFFGGLMVWKSWGMHYIISRGKLNKIKAFLPKSVPNHTTFGGVFGKVWHQLFIPRTSES